MQFPIIVIDSGGDIALFDSIDSAESYIEPIDVDNGEYQIFDSQGRTMLPKVKFGKGFLSPSRVALEVSEVVCATDLRSAIQGYLGRAGFIRENPDVQIELDQLVEILCRHVSVED